MCCPLNNTFGENKIRAFEDPKTSSKDANEDRVPTDKGTSEDGENIEIHTFLYLHEKCMQFPIISCSDNVRGGIILQYHLCENISGEIKETNVHCIDVCVVF